MRAVDPLEINGSQLTDRLRRREEDLCRAILRRVRELAPDGDRDRDPERVEAMRSTIGAAIGAWLRRMERGESGVGGVPAGAWGNVRLAAQNGMSLGATLQSYVTGHLVSWEFIVEEAERLDLAEDARIALLKRASWLETIYFNELVGLVSDEYSREIARMTRGREQRRAQLVREVLDGAPAAEPDLGYPLAGEHIGLLVCADQPDEIVRHLASELDRRLLSVSRSERCMWAWLGGKRRVQAPAVVAAAAAVVGQDDVVAVGEPASGLDGFRLSHRQALAAYRVLQPRGRAIARYADVALVALALEDEGLARSLIDIYLGPLGNGDGRSEVLRATLRAYFAAGQNASSAAAALGVNKRAVAYRLRTVEERLGYPVARCHAALDTALEVEAALRGCA